MPGLPFIEDFSDTALRDEQQTTATWDTQAEQLVLQAWKRRFGNLAVGLESEAGGDSDYITEVAVGDVDGDGFPDIVAGNQGVNRLYLNSGTATPFSAATVALPIGTDGDLTSSIVLGDLDGDGDLDVVAGNSTSFGEVNRYYLNNGTASPFEGVTSGTQIGAESEHTESVELADIDGDGDLDLLVANLGEINRYYLNNGTEQPFSNSTVGHAIGVDTDGTRSIATGDIDGDGDIDLVAGNSGGLNRLYLNNGSPALFYSVSPAPFIGTTGYSTQEIVLGDIDADGDLDIVEGNWNQANRLYRNAGAPGLFTAATTGEAIGSEIEYTRSVQLADFDADGDLDLLTGSVGANYRIYLNSGDASLPFSSLAFVLLFSDSSGSITSLKTGDLDGDGVTDIVAGYYMIGSPGYYLAGKRSETPFGSLSGPVIGDNTADSTDLAVGDLDGDGDLDVAVAHDGARNKLYLNNGTGDPFSDVTTGSDIGTDTDSSQAIALADLDSDGDLDVVVGNGGVAELNRYYLNNGTATPFSGLTSGGWIGVDDDFTWDILAADFNGDGNMDVVTANDGFNRYYPGNGTGSPFSYLVGPAPEIGIDEDDTRAMAAADIDHDGHPDLVAGNFGTLNRVYLNTGGGSPFSATASGNPVGTQADNTQDVALADIDRDGHPDLVVANADASNLYYRNFGISVPFSAGSIANAFGEATDNSHGLDIADADGDGDPDIAVANAFPSPNRLYLNDGPVLPFGASTPVVSIGNIAGTTRAGVLADIDGDGDSDYVAALFGSGDRLSVNRGDRTPFSHAGNEDAIGSDLLASTRMATGDVDGDGDRDLVVAVYGGKNMLYLNNGTATPFAGITTGQFAGSDSEYTTCLALADIDDDGDLDLVVGNENQPNRFYINNGTATPFDPGVSGTPITSRTDITLSLAIADLDGDGDRDVVFGNSGAFNRYTLNNGTSTPFSAASSGVAAGQDTENTRAIRAGDFDGDGDIDLVAGNYGQVNRFYLNDGDASPFDTIVNGTQIGAETDNTLDIGIGDMDGDGDLDLVGMNYYAQSRLYLNGGAPAPFTATTPGDPIGAVTDGMIFHYAIDIGDIDDDGDLDIVEANFGDRNRLYTNNGTATPFSHLMAGSVPFGVRADDSLSILMDDIDGDGRKELLVGNSGQADILYDGRHFNTSGIVGRSLAVDTEEGNVSAATLDAMLAGSQPPNTAIDFYVSNNGGERFFRVMPGQLFDIPASGSDLRWKAVLHSLSPVRSPALDALTLTMDSPPRVATVGSTADTGDGVLDENESTAVSITGLSLTFDQPMKDIGGGSGPDDVSNSVNYKLVYAGMDAVLQTTGCAGGVVPDDVDIPFDTFVYTAPTLTVSITFNGGYALPDGHYALFACGTTTLYGANGLKLDGDGDGTGGDDFIRHFTIDRVPPTLQISSVPQPTSLRPIPFTITFSEPVTGLDASDILIVNGTLVSLTGSGNQYVVQIMPVNDGDVSITIDPGAVIDAAGNSNLSGGTLSVDFRKGQRIFNRILQLAL